MNLSGSLASLGSHLEWLIDMKAYQTFLLIKISLPTVTLSPGLSFNDNKYLIDYNDSFGNKRYRLLPDIVPVLVVLLLKRHGAVAPEVLRRGSMYI